LPGDADLARHQQGQLRQGTRIRESGAAAARRQIVAVWGRHRRVFREARHGGRIEVNEEGLIEYRGVGRRFHGRSGTVVACEDVNLTVRRGEFLAVVGPSGCGKSTLLNMAAGLMAPSMGQVFYDGVPVPSPNTDVGYLTQRDTLLP